MNPTTRFSDRAGDYSVSRPGYSAAALDFILAGTRRPLRAADIGAGTGISSRLLAGRGVDVAAVEPNAAMRRRATACAGVRFIDGTAEATGLPDSEVDLVTAFQAFHWFAHAAALVEFARILRPGGRVALVLNERDERDAFSAAYGVLYLRYALDDTEQRRMRSIETFKQLPGAVARGEFPHRHTLDREGLWRRTVSSSYMPHTGSAARRLAADVDALFDRYAEAGTVRIALRTIVVRIDPALGV